MATNRERIEAPTLRACGARALGRALLLVLAMLLAPDASRAVEVVGKTNVDITFAAASGPVAGYLVYFQYADEPSPGTLTATLPAGQLDLTVGANLGETIVIRVRPFAANGALGPFSPPSEPISFVPDVPSGPAVVEAQTDVGLVFMPLLSGSTVQMQVHRSDTSFAGTFIVRPPAGASAAPFMDARVARCDFDGNGVFEYALGFGDGARGIVEIRGGQSSGFALLTTLSIGSPGFRATSGGTYPACGDIDGDGFDELVVGRGRGGLGLVDVFDDAAANFAWMQEIRLGWDEYEAANGETHPELGDIDGDGLDELLVGLGPGGDGFVSVREDQLDGFRRMWSPTGERGWLRVVNPPGADGATWPAAVQLDGDSAKEIAVGLGKGSKTRIELLDDATRRGFSILPFRAFVLPDGSSALDAGFFGYDLVNGSARPGAVDLDGDGVDEIAVQLGTGGQGRVQLLGQGPGGEPTLAGSAWLQVPLWAVAPHGPALAR